MIFTPVGLLWVGWNGFNGGSALMADGFASLAVLNTNLSAASGLLTWLVLDFIFYPKSRDSPNPVGLATGT